MLTASNRLSFNELTPNHLPCGRSDLLWQRKRRSMPGWPFIWINSVFDQFNRAANFSLSSWLRSEVISGLLYWIERTNLRFWKPPHWGVTLSVCSHEFAYELNSFFFFFFVNNFFHFNEIIFFSSLGCRSHCCQCLQSIRAHAYSIFVIRRQSIAEQAHIEYPCVRNARAWAWPLIGCKFHCASFFFCYCAGR